jgi:hypothetical protein
MMRKNSAGLGVLDPTLVQVGFWEVWLAILPFGSVGLETAVIKA